MASVVRTREHAAAPAAARAVAVLEHLADAPRGAGLVELARALAISPSSLLGLLTTLRDGGYVVRGADDRYRVGVALAALGERAATRLVPAGWFDQVADELVAALGETVLLWRVQGDHAVVVAVRDGVHPLRYVARVGSRLPLRASPLGAALATGRAATGDLDDATSAIAAPLGELSALGAALLGIIGSPARLAGPSGREHVEAAAMRALELSGRAPGHGRAQGGALTAEAMRAFLDEPLVASLGYLNESGFPSAVPVWYEWDGRAIWLLPGPGARWAAQLRSAPHVSLTVGETRPPLRRVNVEGVAHVQVDARRARRLRAALVRKYQDAGALHPAWAQPARTVVRIDPVRLVSWQGLTPRMRLRGIA
jgi:PPOX class probable F420-dependent enzyme